MASKQNDDGAKKVLLVDDHPLMREGLAKLLNQETDLKVCGQAEDAHGAMKAIGELRPDAAVIDITLKDSNGLDLIRDIRVRWPKLPVLVLSMHENPVYAEHAMRAGAQGYISKRQVSTQVVGALRQVLSGRIFIEEAIMVKMLPGLLGNKPGNGNSAVSNLSKREFQVFELIGQGLQTRDIGKQLHISFKTVEAHRENIKKKLDLSNATDLMKFAVEWASLEEKGEA